MKPILSICIPTYNRAPYLKESLLRLTRQIKELPDSTLIELLVSDNCSPDTTEQIVTQFIEEGNAIQYYKNAKNEGMDGNFLRCIERSQGKYVWLLGDDDYLVDGALDKILTVLKGPEIGVLHLQPTHKKNTMGFSNYSNAYEFLEEATFWLTFITANIVNKRYAEKIDFSKYMGSFFVFIPLLMQAALDTKNNIVFHEPLYEGGKAGYSNGVYNLFKVFIDNYLGIWREIIAINPDGKKALKKERYSIFRGFLRGNICQYLIKHVDTGNLYINNAWKILFKEYKGEPYFYWWCFVSYLQVWSNKILPGFEPFLRRLLRR